MKKIMQIKILMQFMNTNLQNAIWEDRPSMSEEKAFLLDVKYAGESSQDKLSKVRAIMKKQNQLYIY